MTLRSSVACRVQTNDKGETIGGGHGGWYGEAGDLCPKCHRTVVVTGQFTEVDITLPPMDERWLTRYLHPY